MFMMVHGRTVSRSLSKSTTCRGFWLSAGTGKEILSKLEFLTTRQLEMSSKLSEMSSKQAKMNSKQFEMSSKQSEMSSKQAEMSSKQQEMSKDLYNIKIVVAAVGMATGLVLTASRFFTLNFKN